MADDVLDDLFGDASDAEALEKASATAGKGSGQSATVDDDDGDTPADRGDKGKGGKGDAPDGVAAKAAQEALERVKALEAREREMQAELSRREEDAKFWQRRAAAIDDERRKPAPEPAPPDPALHDPEKFVEELASRGWEAVAKRLPKQANGNAGLTAEQIREVIREEIGGFTEKLTAQGALARDFPDVADPKSKAHQYFTEELKSLGDLADDPRAMRVAAKAATTRAAAEAKAGDTAARRRQIDAQNPMGSSFDEDADDGNYIDPETRYVMAKMGNAGKEKEFAKTRAGFDKGGKRR